MKIDAKAEKVIDVGPENIVFKLWGSRRFKKGHRRVKQKLQRYARKRQTLARNLSWVKTVGNIAVELG